MFEVFHQAMPMLSVTARYLRNEDVTGCGRKIIPLIRILPLRSQKYNMTTSTSSYSIRLAVMHTFQIGSQNLGHIDNSPCLPNWNAKTFFFPFQSSAARVLVRGSIIFFENNSCFVLIQNNFLARTANRM